MVDERQAAREIAVSGWFDDIWYRKTYQDDESLNFDPVMHYIRYGADSDRDPSAWFSSSGYREHVGPAALAGMNPLWHYLQFGRREGRMVVPSTLNCESHFTARYAVELSAKALESKLWGGFSDDAFPALRAKVLIPAVSDAERAAACWALARWHAARGEFDKALRFLEQRVFIDTDTSYTRDQLVLQANCLAHTGEGEKAWMLANKARARFKGSVDAQLISANALWALDDVQYERDRLSAINKMYQSVGIRPVRKAVPDKPLMLSNLRCDATLAGSEQRELVSIIMPVFNAGETVTFALESILAQSWRHFELLVVDDCSTGDTLDIVTRYCERDTRVRLLKNSRNGGAYHCRNLALAEAKGTLITVHDSDDWSHAEKLERQVSALRDSPEVLASLTDWVRVRNDLFFTGTYRFGGTLVSENLSSLMFRRSVVDELGGWDLVRAGADTEFLRRLQTRYGDSSVVKVCAGVPLSFSMDQPKSLTRTSVTHTRTQFYGPRREYRESAAVWRKIASPNTLRLPPEVNERPFPVPNVMRVMPVANRHYDLVVIADFNMSGGAFGSTMHYVEASLSLGLSVALCQWRRFDLDTTAPFNEALRRRALSGDFDVLAPGDEATAETVLVGYPVVLNHKLDLIPNLRTDRFLILVNQMACRLYSGGDPQYDPAQVTANVQRWFGIYPTWVPISGLVRTLMLEDGRYPAVHDDIWTPLQPVTHRHFEDIRWRGGYRAKPVVGRHSRDHYTKWPKNASRIEQAYCADQACEVRLMGGADCALSVLGRKPHNWVLYPFSDDTEAFLKDLDFYVHFPYEDYIEEFGRAVLEAMSYGIPVILPSAFRSTFGSAATYAEPEEVWQRVAELWQDESAYLRAARNAYEFVSQNSDYRQLAKRLNRQVIPMDKDEKTIFELRQEGESLNASLKEKELLLSQRCREVQVLTEALERRERRPERDFPVYPWYQRFWRVARKKLPGRAVRAIADSPLFDGQWYRDQYPEVERSMLCKISPALHYLTVGGFEGKNPGPDFNSAWYLNVNPDVKAAGLNPLYHYILFGRNDGRLPTPKSYEQKQSVVPRCGTRAPIHFIHIPKTAGTSFRLAASKYYGRRAIVSDYGEQARETSDLVKKYVYKNEDFWGLFQAVRKYGSAMLGGHVPILKYVGDLGVANTVIFFRDPIQRMYSEYQHFVRHKNFKESFRDFYTKSSYINVFSKKLNGVPIEAVGLIGLTEKYSESLMLFNYRYDAELSELEENKGKKHVSSSHDIDSVHVDEFSKLNAKDIELYNYAQALFAQRLELYRGGFQYAHAKLVSVTPKKVLGWAWWEKGGDDPVEVEVRVNGVSFGKAICNDYRTGLLRMGPPRGGYVGFWLSIEASEGDVVDCVVSKTGQVFPPSPVVVEP